MHLAGFNSEGSSDIFNLHVIGSSDAWNESLTDSISDAAEN